MKALSIRQPWAWLSYRRRITGQLGTPHEAESWVYDYNQARKADPTAAGEVQP